MAAAASAINNNFKNDLEQLAQPTVTAAGRGLFYIIASTVVTGSQELIPNIPLRQRWRDPTFFAQQSMQAQNQIEWSEDARHFPIHRADLVQSVRSVTQDDVAGINFAVDERDRHGGEAFHYAVIT